MKLTKNELNKLIDNGIVVKDKLKEINIPFKEKLEREDLLSQLINLAQNLVNGETLEMEV